MREIDRAFGRVQGAIDGLTRELSEMDLQPLPFRRPGVNWSPDDGPRAA